jgi:hypothetical protein
MFFWLDATASCYLHSAGVDLARSLHLPMEIRSFSMRTCFLIVSLVFSGKATPNTARQTLFQGKKNYEINVS